MPVPKCLFFQDLEGLTEVFGGTSAGMSGPKLPLWAEFSFLICWAQNGSLGRLFNMHHVERMLVSKCHRRQHLGVFGLCLFETCFFFTRKAKECKKDIHYVRHMLENVGGGQTCNN